MRIPRTLALLAGIAFALAAPADGARADLGGACRLVNVDSVYFKDGGRRGVYLYVGGMRRFANMDVGFEHRRAGGGVLRVEVVGCTKNFLVLPIPTPYVLEFAMNEVPSARVVEIVAANGVARKRVPGR